jgi:hypothetical protein
MLVSLSNLIDCRTVKVEDHILSGRRSNPVGFYARGKIDGVWGLRVGLTPLFVLGAHWRSNILKLGNAEARVQLSQTVSG